MNGTQAKGDFAHCDGLLNSLQIGAVTHFPRFWRFLRKAPGLRSGADRLIIAQMVGKMKTRPGALSTMSPYTSWPSLNDRTWSERHLPPDPGFQTGLPPVDEAVELFRRPTGSPGRLSDKSTLLFPHFAQWFVDGFLRTDPTNPLKNTSTHDIDLSQLYGQKPEVTKMLRTGDGGRLKSQTINGQEFPPFYFGDDGKPKPEFADLPITYPERDRKGVALDELDADQRRNLFALGIPRGNIHYGFAMMSTVWLREHNRVADAIAAKHGGWDDERIFQTARNTMIVLLLKIVVEDYINHITPFHFKLFVEPGIGEREKWYRQNWMSIEFDMLYRWHPLVPTRVKVGGQQREMAEVLWHNDIVLDNGIARLFDEASRQPAGEVGLRNTADFLMEVERKTMVMGRTAQLASYNDYRKACTYPRVKSFDEISSIPEVRDGLRDVYGGVDKVELYAGLFGEDVRPKAALPTLMGTMVAVDAFSQALTNPLLAPSVFGESTFSSVGMEAIAATSRLIDVVARNTDGESVKPLVTLTQRSWTP